jgi:hypothetical protein
VMALLVTIVAHGIGRRTEVDVTLSGTGSTIQPRVQQLLLSNRRKRRTIRTNTHAEHVCVG